MLGAASGFITGPLLARALGASGRGDLAAVVVPFTLAAGLLSFGISGYSYRALPRGRAVGDVLGSLGLPLVLIGLLVAAAAIPAADALAGGRATVRTLLVVGFASMPLVLVGGLLLQSLGALERWRRVFATNLTPFAVTFVAVVVLYASGRLTVATAGAATIGGALLSTIPGFALLREGRLRFRPSLAREGVSFGVKGWLGGLALTANTRLDQFLMITVVSPRELGLYAVAVTLAGASGLAVGGLSPPLMARIGAGETHLMSQAVRIMLAATIAFNVLLALATPLLLSVVFGPQFSGALPMALILLAAQVPLVGALVLSSALQADGVPLIPTVGEGIALVITISGLAVLLPRLGGLGAAIVSFSAYATSFAYQVVMAHRRTGTPVRTFVIPTREDARWARARIADMTSRLTARA